MEEVKIEKLVHGGQGLGTLESGQKIFVWNALPGETIKARIIKKKRSYVEAIAEEIITSSDERTEPQEENYLATSPWQMMTFEAENKYKKEIVAELFEHEKIVLPDYSDVVHDERQWHYRNKMEYSFWGDDNGLHLALYRRGTHGKQIVSGSKLAMPAIDRAANAILTELQKYSIRAGDLKTVIVRCAQDGTTAAALFVKKKDLPKIELPPELIAIDVYYSDPKSPASVPTSKLYTVGPQATKFWEYFLEDTLLGHTFSYRVNSFFQVNIPIYEKVLNRISEYIDEPNVIDMYSGVGSIGLSVAKDNLVLVEIDPLLNKPIHLNMERVGRARGLSMQAALSASEEAVQYIDGHNKPVIVDPPRAGLHKKLLDRFMEVSTEKIIYLSCNPATQARDIALLQEKYAIEHFEIFNFFPRTPHIETLAVLRRK